ncbi:MAG TPA: VWA domain-containing protein [Pyrinomonadaceae bacterium]|nr:VWA domain-containing protein [Pyrinomonadaceae bacterium]
MSFHRAAAASLRTTLSPPAARPVSLSVLAVLLLFLQLCNLDARAQDETLDASEEEVVRVRTDLVTVPVFVTDSDGRRVPGLRQSDFEVRDGGRAVETSYFAAGTERVALLFLLDASGSTRDLITQQRETALAIFTRFGARSRVAVMHFRERPELALPFTTDIRKAREAFRISAQPDRRTSIFDAALAAVRVFAQGERQSAERRIVILISDGLDTASAARAATVINEAHAGGVSFYVIHLPLFTPREGRLVARRPSKGFRELAEQTGGRFFTVGDARSALDPRAEYDLGPVFKAIADDLLGQYVLGYYAGEAERREGFHAVEVRLAPGARRKLRVRQLRAGYESKGSDK